MNLRRAGAGILAIGLMAWSGMMVWARPPQSDAERALRVEQMYDGFRARFSEVPEVRVGELEALQAAHPDLVLVDVREPEEMAVSTLPGAISAQDFAAHADEYAGRPVVAYCTIGYRSGLWAKEQRDHGVDARNLAGSLLAWTHHGGALVHNGEPTHKVHVYGATWNLAQHDYEAVW